VRVELIQDWERLKRRADATHAHYAGEDVGQGDTKFKPVPPLPPRKTPVVIPDPKSAEYYGGLKRSYFLAVESTGSPDSTTKVYVHYPTRGVLEAERDGLIKRVEEDGLGGIRFERTEKGQKHWESHIAAKKARYGK
jgi:hypothetical protein